MEVHHGIVGCEAMYGKHIVNAPHSQYVYGLNTLNKYVSSLNTLISHVYGQYIVQNPYIALCFRKNLEIDIIVNTLQKKLIKLTIFVETNAI
jgi:hypothetical protein